MPKEIDWSNLNEVFYDAVFPSIVGYDKIIDDFLSNPRAEYHQTWVHEKICLMIQMIKTGTGK
eukprot:2571857-Ditylum_brightwellii.AAC.1